MKIYTNKNEFLNAVESGENTVCLFENTEEPTDELAIQGLNSLARKSKTFNVAPAFLCKITEASGKSKYLYYYALECFFDENLISYSISEFHCNKEQKVIATFGRLFHEVIEQSFILHNNEYDIYQLLYVYKSFLMFDNLSFTDFLESPHFLECNHVTELMNY
ncbi:hypothetical protein ALP72_02253 [Pseudomonas coronafaciens pv. coronafaciens]|uniref:hypothetical protein n=1 Tax=Pseudomonas coronafaciens TaxID=53409 RepID=UPI000F008F76|nr:hypothetical protein [Pseudomonas coronafaciens]RMS11927.1 hypothetical protein ALP72_02253 [Pseudomonas coronafaciens pv. coronafaciens]